MNRTNPNLFPSFDLLDGINESTTCPYCLQAWNKSLAENTLGKFDTNIEVEILATSSSFVLNVMTPYYSEEKLYSKSDLDMENEDGISIMYHLQKIFPELQERKNCKEDSEIFESDERVFHLRHWVSLRGQTLYRTVRGMMNYRRALKLQAFLDIATDIEISQGYKAVTIPSEEEKKSQKSLYA
ncbi:callose synthase 5-like protein [Tanacetum coccineum]